MSLLTDLVKALPLLVVLREKVATLEAEVAALKDENASLKDDLRQAKEENRRLKDQIQEITHPVDLDEAKTQLLVILAERSMMYFESFEAMLETDRVHLEYHLQELVRQKYIALRRPSLTSIPYYSLTQKGRSYLLENHLV
ncbi:MAG TPA: hypothetical protein VKC61_07835 [Pyrinomonadaceae bacterium]|nr:hypothetical protein [Pyrinomonadaceae bacterium]